MAASPKSDDEEKELRTTVLETASIVLQIRQRAEQEILRANEILEQRTRELGQALATIRATLESTTDAILVTDDFKVTAFNEKYLDMWKVPRGAYARGEDRIKAVAAGFQMHIIKPVEARELITMIAGARSLSVVSPPRKL
jgi:PAS domain-containing protein